MLGEVGAVIPKQMKAPLPLFLPFFPSSSGDPELLLLRNHPDHEVHHIDDIVKFTDIQKMNVTKWLLRTMPISKLEKWMILSKSQKIIWSSE